MNIDIFIIAALSYDERMYFKNNWERLVEKYGLSETIPYFKSSYDISQNINERMEYHGESDGNLLLIALSIQTDARNNAEVAVALLLDNQNSNNIQVHHAVEYSDPKSIHSAITYGISHAQDIDAIWHSGVDDFFAAW